MSAFGAVVICILSGLGLASLIWSVVGAFILPVKGGENCRVHMVVDAKGNCGQLQSIVRSLDWILDLGVVEFDTIIVDNGMDRQSLEVAQLLSKKENVSLCCPQQLCDRINNGYCGQR